VVRHEDLWKPEQGTPPLRAHEGERLRLRYRGPYAWEPMLAFLAARAVEGVEQVKGGRYRRTLAAGWIEVAHLHDEGCLLLRGTDPEPRFLASGRCSISTPTWRRARPTWPVTPCWPADRRPARAAGARRLGRLRGGHASGARAAGLGGGGAPPPGNAGAPVREPWVPHGGPGARRGSRRPGHARRPPGHPPGRGGRRSRGPAPLRAQGHRGGHGRPLADDPRRGEWTAQYIALRGAREPDAFPSADLGLLRGAAGPGKRPTPAELLIRAERWRPYRAYAAQHLWTEDVQRMRS
jgi:AraC family transcriptional regulator of adaptative response / DNA-3-methyladenine glycosylase II